MPSPPRVGLVGFAVSIALVAAFSAAACSVDGVTFKPGPGQLAEDCTTPGDEDGNGLADCEDTICGALAQCAPPSCTDQRKNGDELDVDCGGSCPACGPGKACVADGGCAAFGVCDARVCRAAASCNEILKHYPTARDGAYTIAPPATAAFSAVCDMTRDDGGWTLLLKADGNNALFYDAPAWTSTALLNETDLTLTPGNAKYQSFVSLKIDRLRGELDGFRYSLLFNDVTALAIFLGGAIEETPYPTFNDVGGNWSAQPNCRLFGINLLAGRTSVAGHARFGWTANQEDQCLSNDTSIGLGTPSRGAGYQCSSTLCSPTAAVDAAGNGFLWGRDDL